MSNHMTTDTNGAGGLPDDVQRALEYLNSIPGCEPYLRVIVGELCRATREGDGEVDEVIEQLETAADYEDSTCGYSETCIALRNAAATLRTLSRVAVQEDTKRLDFIERRRVAVFPEYQGQWDAELYDEEGEPRASCGGRTPREAIDNMMNATESVSLTASEHAAAQRQEGGSNG